MSRHQFCFIAEKESDTIWRIKDSEARHLKKVLKLRAGDTVELTDGEGSWGFGRIEDIHDSQSISIRIVQMNFYEQLSQINVVIGALKPSSFDDILPALVELGVHEIHLFSQSKTDRKRLNSKLLERWNRILIAAIKQSKRAWLPKICLHNSLQDYLDQAKSRLPQGIVLEPDAASSLSNIEIETDRPINLVIGSESGLQIEELSSLKDKGYQPCKIGPHILRATTASVAAMAIVSARLT